MTSRKRPDASLFRAALLWSTVALFVLAGLAAQPAAAADYVLSGQVRTVDPVEAADEEIATDDLTLGNALPFVKVVILDRGTGAQLAEGWTGQNGQYTLQLSAGSPAEVEARVFLPADGDLRPLDPARDGINEATLTSAGGVTSVGFMIRVESDLILAAGSLGVPLPHAGVGLVFTRVGKVEIPYIEQSTVHMPVGEIGLADMSGDLATAEQLGLPDEPNPTNANHYPSVFEQAPFGGRLMIFGSFGQPGGVHPTCALSVDMYQVEIETLDEATLPAANPGVVTSEIYDDPMSKKRWDIQTFPFVNVTTAAVKIGPYSGQEGGVDIPGLYLVAPDDTVNPALQTFYSFPDLRVNWVSSGHNGLVRLTVRYFHRNGWITPNVVADVTEIDPSCFAGPFPAAISDAAIHKLVLRVNNQPLLTSINHIYLHNGAGYLAPDGTRVPTPDLALDFNGAGLCEIMRFEAGDEVEIDFTARHVGGYLRYYDLRASSNDGASVSYVSDTFAGKVTLPLWHGTAAPAAPPALPTGTVAANAEPFPHDCVYTFHLSAASRVQNGYGYLQRRHPTRAYFIDLP